MRLLAGYIRSLVESLFHCLPDFKFAGQLKYKTIEMCMSNMKLKG